MFIANGDMPAGERHNPSGRFPANVCHDGSPEVLAGFPAQGRSTKPSRTGTSFRNDGMFVPGRDIQPLKHDDNGGSAARFFYCAKASRSERNAGLEEKDWRDNQPTSKRNTGAIYESNGRLGAPRENHHPTVKPIALMRWLVRLVTPPGGVILDPFMGSGTTGCAAVLEGFDFIGCDLDADYVEISRRRIDHWSKQQPTLL
jgi:site-specific DNA-methyltransferase (adenine-specific)